VTFPLLFLLSLMVPLLAPAQMPAPAPEVKNLDYFAGNWSMEGDMKAGPWGPGGKFTGTEKSEWMEGNYFLVSHSEMSMPMGKGKGIAFMGFNADEKKYTYNGFNSMGENETAMGTMEGGDWVFTNESKMGGQMVKGRYSMHPVSPTSYTFKFEMAQADGNFATMMEGKATKK
jgi:hypothetical protein